MRVQVSCTLFNNLAARRLILLNGNETGKSQNMFVKALDNVEIGICFAGMFAMTVIIFIHVICRYVLKSPLTWSEEVAKMCLIWITFGGSSYAFKEGAHVGVTLLVDRLPGNSKKIAEIVINILIIVFFAILLVFGTKIFLGQAGKFSKAAHIPMMIPYSSIPIGAFLVILRILVDTFGKIKNFKNKEVVK